VTICNRCTAFLPSILCSALLCLWFLSNLTALSCHSPMVDGGSSASANFVMIDLISYKCLPCIYLMAQSVPHWWGMFFTQQISCLPHIFLIHSSWYIGIYTVDTLLYSLRFTNCIIPFLLLLSIYSRVFT